MKREKGAGKACALFWLNENHQLGWWFSEVYSYAYVIKLLLICEERRAVWQLSVVANQKEVTMGDAKSLAHTKWNCKYHIVFAPKYRRQVFYGEKKRAIGEIL